MLNNPDEDLHQLVNLIRRKGKQVELDISTMKYENKQMSVELRKFQKLTDANKGQEVCDATTFSVFSKTSDLTQSNVDLEHYKIAYYVANKDSRKYYECPIVGSTGFQYMPINVNIGISIRDGVNYNVLRNTLTRLLRLCDEHEYHAFSLERVASDDNAVYSKGRMLVL